MRNPVLAQTIDIRLGLSDWLTLCGWMSAHLTEASPDLIVRNVQAIGVQITHKAKNAEPETDDPEYWPEFEHAEDGDDV